MIKGSFKRIALNSSFISLKKSFYVSNALMYSGELVEMKDFYNRKVETKFLFELLHDTPSIEVFVGEQNTGKTYLLMEALRQFSDPKNPNNKTPGAVGYINFREIGFESFQDLYSHFAETSFWIYLKTMAKNMKVQWKDIISGMVNLDIQLPTERRPNDVTIKDFIGCFSNISNAMKSTDRVLFIDEANALMKLEKTERDNLALEQLLNWFLHATKETNALHIWLATSDSFFFDWLTDKVGDRVCPNVIGDLNAADAQGYFTYLASTKSADDFTKLQFIDFKKDIFPYTGGRMFIIQQVMKEYLRKGVLPKDSFIISNARRLLHECINEKRNSKCLLCSKDDLDFVITNIAKFGFIDYDVAKETIGMEAIVNLIDNKILNYRPARPMVEDIPNQPQYALVAPSQAVRYVMREMYGMKNEELLEQYKHQFENPTET